LEKKQARYLRQSGLTATYYYRETTTVCLLVNSEATEIIARGVAICSPLDQFNKRIGRAKALGMALRAFMVGTDSGLIMKRHAHHPSNLAALRFGYRSAHYPQPKEYEGTILKILQKIRERKEVKVD